MIPNPVAGARAVIAEGVRSVFSADRLPGEQYTDPPGDPGLFGPDSVTWKVHADVSMFVGGLSALMLQTLHPLTMAGVADHSNYRDAPLHRLGRTASFVAATTYASTPVAERMIAMVRRIHERVVGVAPDGRPYDATDPALITWVHVAEAVSFLNAHRRYHPFPLRGADLDRYYAETATVAERLGGRDVPRSYDEVRQYLRDIRPELTSSEQVEDVMRFLRRPIGSDPASQAASVVLIEAAVDLLPPWAQRLHGISRPPGFDVALVRPPAGALLMALRLALGESPILAEARERVGRQPASDAASAEKIRSSM